MKIRDVESGFLIRLERGEKVLAAIAEFCETREIKGGFFHGLGAVMNTEIGYYPLETREYVFENHPEDREVASMTGNVALVDGKPFIHCHAVLSACKPGLEVIGGHIRECEVAVTLEIYLTPFPTPISRAHDESNGLKLLDI